MDKRERFDFPQEALRAAIDGALASLQTSMPGIIQSFDPQKMTAVVQPAIRAVVTNPDYTIRELNLPLLVDCPVVFPCGGGYTLTFPIKPGDECQVIFASRCIDNWWLAGGIQSQAEIRLHDISDGFVYVGPRSQPRTIGVSTDSTQLRSDSGDTYVELSGTDINLVSPSNVSVSAGGNISMDAGGNLALTAGGNLSMQVGTGIQVSTASNNIDIGPINITPDGAVSMNGKRIDVHRHSGVQTGSGNTGDNI